MIIIIAVVVIALIVLAMFVTILIKSRSSVNPDGEDVKILKAKTKGDSVTVLSDVRPSSRIDRASMETDTLEGEHVE